MWRHDPTDEWLETDGLGGFAMGTVSTERTRRYHSLLTVAAHPPGDRQVLVAGVEVYLRTQGGVFGLSRQRYADETVVSDVDPYRAAFDHEPWPRWTWRLPDGTEVVHELFVTRGRPRITLRWWWTAEDAELTVRPLCAGRGFHNLQHEDERPFLAEVVKGAVRWDMGDAPAVFARADGHYTHAPVWYRRFLYTEERARGLDHVEDLWSPGRWTFRGGSRADLILGTDADATEASASGEAEAAAVAEANRRQAFASPLHRAADAYLVDRPMRNGAIGKTIIAGYPWFEDWGRDTFVALPGLCLHTGRLEEAISILTAWAEAVSEGQVPNRFAGDGATPEYNTVDAGLWYVLAAVEVLRRAPTCAAAAQLEAAVGDILRGYAAGARHGIGADEDGLLACGAPGFQLTWMDARVGDREITPRIGKPVEIQALWLNALALAAPVVPDLQPLAHLGRRNFFRRFVDRERPTLADVVDVDHVPGAVDVTVRPNQIFALGALPMALVEGAEAKRALDVVEQTLLTPMGIRTLDPSDPAYRGWYGGGVSERDGAYHQGTAWPWLMGPFVRAWLRVHGDTPAHRSVARDRFLAPVVAHLAHAGLGHVSEIVDGDAPHAPRGCPFQAWSVAELISLQQLLEVS